MAYDLVKRLEAAPLVDVAKVVTYLGCAADRARARRSGRSSSCCSRREFVEALVLGVGMALTYAGVHITKAATDRLRPPDPLVATDLSSYPSGHAAYAVAWVAVAVAVSRVLPGIASRFVVVTVAVVIAVAVGLSRVYLRAHWLSDVTGGAGLGGGAASALCGAVALVVSYVRHNGRQSGLTRPSA